MTAWRRGETKQLKVCLISIKIVVLLLQSTLWFLAISAVIFQLFNWPPQHNLESNAWLTSFFKGWKKVNLNHNVFIAKNGMKLWNWKGISTQKWLQNSSDKYHVWWFLVVSWFCQSANIFWQFFPKMDTSIDGLVWYVNPQGF